MIIIFTDTDNTDKKLQEIHIQLGTGVPRNTQNKVPVTNNKFTLV